MNEALKVLCDRRSIRRYKSEQISREEMEAVIRAGVCAASGKNGQSAIIIAVQDKQTRDLLRPHPFTGKEVCLSMVFPFRCACVTLEVGATAAVYPMVHHTSSAKQVLPQ